MLPLLLSGCAPAGDLVIHAGTSAEEAVRYLASLRGKDLDRIVKSLASR